jgi:hypothetical protein
MGGEKHMKRIALILSLLVGALAFTAAGIAGPGQGGAKSQSSKNNTFKFTVTTTDGSSCGAAQVWATDVVQRTFKVMKRGPNKYSITRWDRGRFTTNGTLSPGKCETKGKHGSTVKAGVVGHMEGYLVGTVTGTYNKNATCTVDCGFTDTFITTHFGAAAVNTFTCFNGYAGCKFNFQYSSNDKSLKFHHWQDRGTNGVTEQFIGDIANS